MFQRTIVFCGAVVLVLAALSPVQGGFDVRINPSTGAVDLVVVGDMQALCYDLETTDPSNLWFTFTRWNTLADQGFGTMPLGTDDPSFFLTEVSMMPFPVTDGTVLSLGTPYVGPSNPSVSDFVFQYIWTPDTIENSVLSFGEVTFVPPSGPLPGDANGDGSVDGTDLNTVLSNYGVTSGGAWAAGDFNGDGAIDGTDLNVVLSNYGTTSGATAAVPEPCTLGLLALGAIGLLAYAWRKRK
jgi:hypothetical protein